MVNLLVGYNFYYFGSSSLELTSKLNDLIIGRGHRVITEPNVIKDFQRHIDSYEPGLHGQPSLRER